MDKFDDVVKNYYRGAAGALAVTDLTRPETITQVKGILDQFLLISSGAALLLLGNKLDIFQRDHETMKLLEKTADEFSMESILTSAKTGETVEKAFLTLANKIGGR